MIIKGLRIKKFSEHARTPEYAHDGDSGLDLFVANEDRDPLWPGETRTYWTDIGVATPEGFEAQVRPRSGWSKRGVQVLFYGFVTALGTVDQPYTGNIGVTVFNATREPVPIPRGTKIAQIVFAPVARVDTGSIVEVDEFDHTSRGANGFGSTGNGGQR